MRLPKLSASILPTLAFTLLLTGCGFHLRGHAPLSLTHIHVMNVEPDAPYTPLYKGVKHALNAAGIKIREDENAYTLHLIKEELKTLTLAYGPKGQIRRERLTYTLSYKVEDKKSNLKKTLESKNKDLSKGKGKDTGNDTGKDTDTEKTKVNPHELISMREIVTIRDRQLHPDQTLADEEEKILLHKEMRQDVISQLIYQLDSLLPKD